MSLLPASRLALLVAFFFTAATAGTARAQSLQSAPSLPSLAGHEATIHWDAMGVPFITARDDRALLFGQGWAMAECRYFELKGMYVTATGRSASFLEPGDFGICGRIGSDLGRQQFDIPGHAKAVWAAMPKQTKELVQAFADGINAWWDEAADQEALIALYNHEALLREPVTARDVVALAFEVPTQQLVGAAVGLLTNPTDLAPLPKSSDAWAVGAWATASGNALLLADPHLPLGSPATTFLSVLHGDTVRGAGCSFLGIPFLGVGTQLPRTHIPGDQLVAWSSTSGPMDQVDVFHLQTNPAGTAYLLEGQEVPFTTRTVSVSLPPWMASAPACSTGVMIDVLAGTASQVVKDCVFGNLLAEGAGEAWAVQTVLHDGSDMLGQLHEMLTARDLPEFLDALDRRALLGGNYLIATDDDSDPARGIAYTLSGPCPVRDENEDWSRVIEIAPSDDASLAWDPTEPGTLHSQSAMPTVLGDAQDHFMNNNVGIRATWLGFDADDYPESMIGRADAAYHAEHVNYRQDRGRSLLSGALPGMTFAQCRDFATDNSYNEARFAIPLISQAYTDHGTVRYPDVLPLVLQLDSWLLEDPPAGAHVGSEAAAVYRFWPSFFRAELMAAGLLIDGEPIPIPFPELDPFAPPAPPWPQAEAEAALMALRRVRDLLECNNWNVPAWPLLTWGDIHVLKGDALGPPQLTLPMDGAPTALRAFQLLTLPAALTQAPFSCATVSGGELQLSVNHGASCAMVIELDSSGPRVDYMKAKDNAFSAQIMSSLTAGGRWSSASTSVASARATAVRTEFLSYLGPPQKR